MGQPLPRSSPEAEGIRAGTVEGLVRAAATGGLGLHSLMVLRRGRVVAEVWWAPYARDAPHTLFSVSKSFTATAVGIAADERLLSLDEPVVAFFPTMVTARARASMNGVRVRDLLTMSAGHGQDSLSVLRALPAEDWARLFMEIPLTFPPGRHFEYDSGCSYMLSALVLSRTGETVLDILKRKVFGPLGIGPSTWAGDERGIPLGWTGLSLTTEDLAKFGQLYLQRGAWHGQQLLSEEWVAAATALQVGTGSDPDDDWSQGYGFQFWRSRHDSFRADGAFGQFCFVLPAQEMVVAITAGTDEPHRIPGVLWDALLPGVLELPAHGSAGSSEAAVSRQERLQQPTFVTSDGGVAEALDGRRVVLPFNTVGIDAVGVTLGASAIDFRLEIADGREELVHAGRQEWLAGASSTLRYEEFDGGPTASIAGWIGPSRLQLRQQFVETPFARVWEFEPLDGHACRVTIRLDPGPWIGRVEELVGEIV